MQDHHKVFGGFIFFMILLFIAWIMSGGPQRALETGSANNKFIDQAAPLGTGQTYNKIGNPPEGAQFQIQ